MTDEEKIAALRESLVPIVASAMGRGSEPASDSAFIRLFNALKDNDEFWAALQADKDAKLVAEKQQLQARLTEVTAKIAARKP